MATSDQIESNFTGKNIVSLDQFDKQSLEKLFHITAKIKKNIPTTALSTTLTTLLFYEPSSRTFGSFSAAIKRMGGATIDIHNATHTSSVAKGETLTDTVRAFANYSDAIVIRHPEIGSAKKAADAIGIPVINAGDGAGEHPTQALLDMFTIYEKFGRLDDLTILFAGDMKNGRTVHSILRGLSRFTNVRVYLLSPDSLRLSKNEIDDFTNRGITITEITSESAMPKDAKVWYWTRVQKERFSDSTEYEKTKNAFVLDEKMLKTYGNNDMIIMHPLPRVGEIVEAIDSDQRALYLTEEMKNGMYVRMALMGLVLGKIE